MFCFLSISFVTIGLLSFPVVKCILQRGAFQSEATAGVSVLLPVLSIGVVAMICTILLIRGLFAKRDVAGAVVSATCGAFIYFVLSGVLSPKFGLNGILLAYSISWLIQFIFVFHRIWAGDLNSIWNRQTLQYFIRLFVSLVAAAGIVILGRHFVIIPHIDSNNISLGFRLAIVAAAGGFCFLSITASLFKMPEVLILFTVLRRFKQKSATYKEIN